MPELTYAQRTPEWLEARRGKITASLAAACLRIGPKSAASAWREITGQQTEAEQRHSTEGFELRYGVNFEPVARNCYEAESGNLVTETGFWTHPDLPWLGASPDGLVGRDGLLECKCLVRTPASVPHHHRVQCLVQLACTGRAWVDYFVWPHPDSGDAPRTWRIHRCGGIVGLILKLDQFRRDYILTGVCPPRKAWRTHQDRGQ